MPQQPLSVRRWETEIPLLILVVVASIALWAFIVVSLVGLVYTAFLMVLLFLAHVAFVAHVRGSAVKLGPEQLPDLHARVQAIAQRLGIETVPDAYVMQAGGALNALATKLLGADVIVLFSDLIDACDDDPEALDFIIAHELGHLKAGHLRFQWLLIGQMIPFLGGAYSRAREYTADRYGVAAVSDRRAAIRGLTVLAAGGRRAKQVNPSAFVEQRRDMTGVLMTLGRWMSTHPPLVDRVAEADRSLGGPAPDATRGIAGAVALIAFALLAPTIGGGFVFVKFVKKLQEQTAQLEPTQAAVVPPAPTAAEAKMAEVVRRDLERLAAAARKHHETHGSMPANADALYAALRAFDPAAGEPHDPFSGARYRYHRTARGCVIFSSGDSLEQFAGQLAVMVEE